MKGGRYTRSTQCSQSLNSRAVWVSCVALAMGLHACALPHAAHGEVDSGPIIDEQFVDRIALGDADVIVAPDTLDATDTPIVSPDVVDDDVTVPIDVPDVPPPMDIPTPIDIPPPIDVPVPIDVPPDRIVMIDVVDIPPPMDVPTTTPAGDPCTSGTICEPNASCFMFSATRSFCEFCGGYGERPCPGRVCREGTYDGTSDSCIHAATTHFGEAGGACVGSSDCGSLGQCIAIAGGAARACLECGAVGQACCCPDGRSTSCACNGGGTCQLTAGGGWTVCR